MAVIRNRETVRAECEKLGAIKVRADVDANPPDWEREHKLEWLYEQEKKPVPWAMYSLLVALIALGVTVYFALYR